MTKPKASAPFYALATITIGLSSWGLFRLFVDFAGMPPWLAWVAVGGLDLVAVLFGKHALAVSADGDSPAPWNAALLLFTTLAGAAQYWHALLADQPRIIGVTMAAFPLATVLLFEGQLRRAARLNGRKLGLVPPPRAKLPLIVWLHFPRRSWDHTRAALLARLDGPKEAPPVAEATARRSGSPGRLQPKSRVPQRPAEGTRGQQTVYRQTIAQAVREARLELGDNPEAITARVQKAFPDRAVSEDTVRRTLNRENRTNGHSPVGG